VTLNGTVISTGQLLSVPYALNALSSSSSQWLNGSGGAIYYSGGNVQIKGNNDLQLVAGSGSPYDPGDVAFFNSDGTTQRARIWMDPVSSTGGLQFVANATGSPQVYLTHDGNVGIGTTSPTNRLHLSGTTDRFGMTIESNAPGFGPEIHLTSTATNGHEWRIVSGASASNSYGAGSFELWDATAGASRFGILPNGNVGIGTHNPTNLLHLASSSVPTLMLENTSLTSNYAKIGLGNSGESKNWEIGTDFNQGNGDNFYIWQGSADADRFNIDASGRVGIGTTTPTTNLDVNGTIRIRGGSPAQVKYYHPVQMALLHGQQIHRLLPLLRQHYPAHLGLGRLPHLYIPVQHLPCLRANGLSRLLYLFLILLASNVGFDQRSQMDQEFLPDLLILLAPI